ncbi:MAG: acyl-ACP--UDP-N-acetylglucosamine O-acyltransferase [Candidatus Competibacteraceae bacterium]|nr:acyl-ACP--UDP-N-acetylglucosamine O-acyltransferase [Candidatus Competibacteraceae bacterium]
MCCRLYATKRQGKPPRQDLMIHPTAIIHPDTRLGNRVSLGAYAVIDAGVTIGDDCHIGHHAVIEGPTELGRNNHISPHACIGTPAQELSPGEQSTRLVIGDNNVIREFVAIHRGSTKDEGITRIGHHNFLMTYTHVGHDCTIGDHVVTANAVALGGHVSVGNYVNIGGSCAVHQFTRIGAYAMIGGGSMVTLDILPFMMAVGDRVKLYGLNRVGLKRHGFNATTIQQLKRAYKLLFRCNLRLDEAVTAIHESGLDESSAVAQLIAFIAESKRGIAR